MKMQAPAVGLLGALLVVSPASGDAAQLRRDDSFREQPPTARRQKSAEFSTWENVALAIPARSAGCGSQGAVLVVADASYGRRHAVWRGSLKCFASNKPGCAMTQTNLGSAAWPDVSVTGFDDDLDHASDKQIVRFADGTILLLHQGIRRDAGTTARCDSAEGTCRGAEYLFHSNDCGATWRLVSVLDPASDGPASEPDRYYDHSTQHGHDRPEIYADPFNPGRVYMTVLGWGDGFAVIVLYRSDDRGITWRHVAELPQIWTGAYMTSLPSGRLYVAGWFGAGPPHNFGVYVYDPASNGLTGPLSSGADLARAPVTRMAAGSEGISRIATMPAGDYVRVHTTYRTATGDYGLVVRAVRIAGATLDVVDEYRYVPPAGTSVVGPSVIETDRLEWQPGDSPDPAFIYWYETRTAASGNSFGPARVVGQRFDGMTAGNIFCLTLDGTARRTWPVFHDVYGDYHRGAFWYDARKRKLGFLAIWGEQIASGSGSFHSNVLTLVRR